MNLGLTGQHSMLETTACSFHICLSLSSLATCEYYSSRHNIEDCCSGHRSGQSCAIVTLLAVNILAVKEMTDPTSLPQTQPALASSFRGV